MKVIELVGQARTVRRPAAIPAAAIRKDHQHVHGSIDN